MRVPSWRTRRAKALVLAGFVTFASAGCEQKVQPAFERPPAPVTVAAAVARDTALYLDEVGKCVAMEVVAIQPQISGRIVKIHFTDGADVKRGDPLFTIDPRPMQATVQQAEANTARDQATVRQAQATLTQAQAQAAQAEANVVRDQAQVDNARTQNSRYEELVRQGYVAREQADQVRTALETAVATLRADQAMIDSARANIAAAEATLAQARAAALAGQAAVDNARLQLAYTDVRSPIDGRAGQRLADLGNVVTANTGSLLSIQRVDPIYAEFTVTEGELTRVQQQMARGPLPVEVRLPDQADAPMPGTLTFLDNAVQEGTGTVKLRATVPNASRRLWPGRFVNVRLILDRVQGAVLIPAVAPQVSARGQFVYVVKDDGTADLRPVTLGQRQGDLVIVSAGVKAGERVVTSGQMAVAPGGKVRIDATGEVGKPAAPAAGGQS